METNIWVVDNFVENQTNEKRIIDAAGLLTGGQLVAFPTETVYGLGANALDANAVKKIYLAKGRPSDNPLIVHFSNKDNLKEYVEGISEKAKKLMDEFWPGPMTLVFQKKRRCFPR